MFGRLLCFFGIHKLRGALVPHTYRCVRDHSVWQDGVHYYRECPFRDAGHP